MTFNRYKPQNLALYIGTLLFVVLLAILYWNIFLQHPDKKSAGIWALIFFIFAIVCVSGLYINYLKATNNKILENFISQQIEEERTKILAEFSKQDNKEVETENIVEIKQKASNIVPKGSFKNSDSFAKKFLNNLAEAFDITQGIFYIASEDNNSYAFLAGYALTNTDPIPDFKLGENLNGQVAASKEILIVKDVPDDYLSVESGLGKSKPENLVIVPFIYEDKTVALLEFTSFQEITNTVVNIIEEFSRQTAEKLLQLKMS